MCTCGGECKGSHQAEAVPLVAKRPYIVIRITALWQLRQPSDNLARHSEYLDYWFVEIIGVVFMKLVSVI